MLESYLRVPNLCWLDGQLNPLDGDNIRAVTARGLDGVHGRFATVHQDSDGILLARDKLGLNKLFFAFDPMRGLVAANYLADLLNTGIPFGAIYAVPAGATVEINLEQRALTIRRYHRLPRRAGGDPHTSAMLAAARQQLVRSFELLAAAFPDSKVAVCLSGGLDSALIATLATCHFTNVVAYTYTFTGPTDRPSPDASAAEHLAAHLGLAFRLVTADAEKVLGALRRALRNGQDWRDFNVHCAIVNEVLAETIAIDVAATEDNRRTLVLTGDLMNEVLGDYTPVPYRGRHYYRLPALPPDLLRISLVRGIQTGDREVGVFTARGLDMAQPYASKHSALAGVVGWAR